MEFQGKIALVTGGGQGFGKATALALAGEGADVVVNDLNLDLAERTAKEVRAIGPRAIAIQANVAIEKEVEAMVARIVNEWGGIDILVNNAGTGRPMMVEDMDKSEWDRILNINLGGVFNCSRAVIPTIIAQARSGKEVKLGSLKPTRDYTYVTDTAEGFIRIAESEKSAGEVINIGSNSEVAIGELAEKIIKNMGSQAKIVCDESRIRPKNSEVERLRCDNSKAKKLISWKPKVSLDSGLKKTIDWVTDNMQLFKPGIYNR